MAVKPSAARATALPSCHLEVFAPYNMAVRIRQLMNRDAGNDRVMPNDGSEAFSGFPAVSLPSLRLLPSVVAKPMIRRDFSAQGEAREKPYPEFSRVAGKDRGGLTLPAGAALAFAAVTGSAGIAAITPRIVAVQPAAAPAGRGFERECRTAPRLSWTFSRPNG